MCTDWTVQTESSEHLPLTVNAILFLNFLFLRIFFFDTDFNLCILDNRYLILVPHLATFFIFNLVQKWREYLNSKCTFCQHNCSKMQKNRTWWKLGLTFTWKLEFWKATFIQWIYRTTWPAVARAGEASTYSRRIAYIPAHSNHINNFF